MNSNPAFWALAIAVTTLLAAAMVVAPALRIPFGIALIAELLIFVRFWGELPRRIAAGSLFEMSKQDVALGTFCYVQSVDRWFRLELREGRTADGVTTITSSLHLEHIWVVTSRADVFRNSSPRRAQRP